MGILLHLMDELLTDVEVTIRQLPARPYVMDECTPHGVFDATTVDIDGCREKRVYLLGGLRHPTSRVVLDDGRGCTLVVKRQLMGWIIVEFTDGRTAVPSPVVHSVLLNRGEVVEVADTHGRRVTITLLRRRVSRPILHKLGFFI